MLHNHLKQGLRLNRTIGFAFLMYGAGLLLLCQFGPNPQATQWTSVWLRFGGLCLISALFLLINEVSLKSLKRHPRLDDLTLEKLSLLIPLISCGYVAAAYLITGQVGIALFAFIVALQAQLFAHSTIARMTMVMLGLLYLISWPLGYPILLGFPHASLPHLSFGTQVLLMVLPLLWALGHYGNIVATLVRTTSTRVSKLQSLAATDGLTGLINRRQFNTRLDTEIARAKRYRNHPLSLALFDIDDFKKINDFYGHPTGDRILKELGQLITANVRESDVPARYGGEEFALILPETGQIDAYDLLERLRALIEGTVFCLPDNPMTVTISVGVAQLDLEHARAYELIEKADAALYEAKRQGKNQVVYGILPAPKVTYPPFNG
jgi:diguanylate cyclase (GGDEF)-like protein